MLQTNEQLIEYLSFLVRDRIKYFEKIQGKAKKEHAGHLIMYYRGIIEGLVQFQDLLQNFKE
jgi:hypothetical protein